MRTLKIAFAIAALCLTAQGFASDVIDDTIKLANSGVAEEVIVAWAAKQHTLDVTVKNIVALKDAKVSDKVILALIKGADTGAPTEQRWLGRDGQIETAPAKQASGPTTRYEPNYD